MPTLFKGHVIYRPANGSICVVQVQFIPMLGEIVKMELVNVLVNPCCSCNVFELPPFAH